MSIRTWLSVGTLLLVLLLIVASWSELEKAWVLTQTMNTWWLLLLIPLQFISYYAGGAASFSYLRKKGVDNISTLAMTRLALELNFVNHILPSGGVSGVSYMSWVLAKYGVPSGQAAMAQVVRIVATFVAFLTLLGVSFFFVVLDGAVSRPAIAATAALITVVSIIIGALAFALSSKRRMKIVASCLARSINWLGRMVRVREPVVSPHKLEHIFEDIHKDYAALRREPRILIKPFLWGLLFVISDALMIYVAFLAIGLTINPAALIVAFGVANALAILTVTPGGAGGYELGMISYLTTTGLPQSSVVAAVLVARMALIAGAIGTGYVFYQLTIQKYGKSDALAK